MSQGHSAEGRLLLGVAGGTSLRWAAVELTAAVEVARRRHDLAPVAAAALGRAFAGAVLLKALSVRACDRLALEIRGDGPIGKLFAEVDAAGNLRGYVGNPRVEVPDRPDGKLAVGAAVGSGMLRVLRDLDDGTTYESQVALQGGEIGIDLAHYLEQSEQTDSAVLVGVLAGPEGVRAAGGLLIEVMPGARSGPVGRLEANLEAIGGISRAVADGGLELLLDRTLAGLDRRVTEASGVRFHCRCRRDSLREHLVLLSTEELAEVAEPDGSIAAECAFCAERYLFEAFELAPQ